MREIEEVDEGLHVTSHDDLLANRLPVQHAVVCA